MNKLKSAVRLRKGPDDASQTALHDAVPSIASLKRSGAKLRKRGQDAATPTDEHPEEAEKLEPAAVSDMFHFGSRENSWEQGKPDCILPAMSPKTGAEHVTSFSKLFSKMKTKQRQEPTIDNFTMWDNKSTLGRYGMAPHPSNLTSASTLSINKSTPSRSRARHSAFSSFDTSNSRPLHRTSTAASSVDDNDVSSDVQADLGSYFRFDSKDGQAISGAKRPKGKGKVPHILDIDWSDYDDSEALRMLLSSYSVEPLQAQVSPTDSGIGLMSADVSVVAEPKSPSAEIRNADSWWLDEQKIQQEIEATTREWSDRLHALQLQKEEELERQRLEEEAFRIAEAERVAREIQEEEDRRRALELAAEEERLAAELARRRDCICCGDTYDPEDLPLSNTSCAHDPQTCTSCMHQWLSSELSSKGASANITCPECPTVLDFADIQRLATPETFSSYEALLMRSTLSSLPEFSWCLKGDECGSGQLNPENDDTHFMDCQNCGYKQCLKCCVEWHKGETCDQYQYRVSGKKAKDEEAATEKMIDEISKKCPGKGCGWRIQKIDGCDHMTCKRCHWEFCWECLASHREIKKIGNTAHQKTCKFHSDNLETAWPFNVHA